MNTEQLQMLLNTFDDATTGAYIIGILWVIKGYFIFSLGMGVIIYAVRTITNLIRNSILSVNLGKMAGLNPKFYGDVREIKRIFQAGIDAPYTK